VFGGLSQLLSQFADLTSLGLPLFVEERFEQAVMTKNDEAVFIKHCLNPVLAQNVWDRRLVDGEPSGVSDTASFQGMLC
jgi:hypothetical protein